MKLVLLAVLFSTLGCANDTEPVEINIGSGIIATVKPQPTPDAAPAIWVSCEILADGYSCHCLASECTAAGIKAMAEECNRLRHPVVVE